MGDGRTRTGTGPECWCAPLTYQLAGASANFATSPIIIVVFQMVESGYSLESLRQQSENIQYPIIFYCVRY